MKLYIVRGYPDEHKMHVDSWIVGIFTNRSLLARAVRKFSSKLGVSDFDKWLAAFNSNDFPNQFLETGYIEQVDANTCFEEGELS